jgi:Ala-tRNA(Pro) deacylase
MLDTTVTRLLLLHEIQYKVLAHSNVAFTVQAAAEARGVPPSEMIKCLVFLPRKGPRLVVACLPGSERLSMPKLKAAAGAKEFRSSTREMIAEAVGFPVGAIPPIALPEDAMVLVDTAILLKPVVNISSGDPLAGLELLLHDLRKVLRCKFVDIVE